MSAAPPAPGKFVEVGGRRIHYVEKGSGPTVVFLHGFFFHTAMWRETIDALAPKFRCIAIDLFGFGWSAIPRAPDEAIYGYDLWRDQLAGFLDALGIERAHLVGQSLGGGTIVSFAVQQPKRVASAVLVCPAGLPNPADEKNRTPLLWPLVGEVAFWLMGPKKLVRKVLIDHFMHDPRKVTDAYVETIAAPTTRPGYSAAALWIMRNVNLGGIPERFDAYPRGIPTLLIWGKDDKGIPVSNAELAREKLRPERVLLIDAAGHNPHQEQPEVANPVIRDFLAAHVEAPQPS